MNIIHFRRSRVLKLSLVCFVALVLFVLLLRQLPYDNGTDRLKAGQPMSHSMARPKFLGAGKIGNFEPPESVKKTSKMGPGENGAARKLTFEQRGAEERLKAVYGFNQLVSDEISLNRTVPDLRESECASWDYPTDLPKASVVLVFHNEGWSTLFRTVHSVINRSPPQFLEEVVLVDDESELSHLHRQLEQELEKPYYKGRVRLVRNKEREGLIRSRNNGAVAARGEVVIFLDAHCEVGYNWLPPLLAPIYEDRRSLAVPVIDGISWEDFSINPVYARNSHSRGIFEWGMLYKEGTVPAKEERRRSHHSEPYYAPTHAGGLFAISRSWFEELGWYDPGLWVWGAENFELSFKVWMCGGNAVWVPCSRVSHVYRGHSCSSCHSGKLANKFNGQPTTLRNYKRVIETWFDPEYKEFFYTREPLARFVEMGDISEQLALKEKLKCKNFEWFMKEVAYDVFDKYPKLPPNEYWGELVNMAHGFCLDTYGRHPPEQVGSAPCHHGGGYQLQRLNTKGQLTCGEWCSELGGEDRKHLHVKWCRDGTVDGPWSYDKDTKQLLHRKTGLCLMLDPSSDQPIVRKCDKNNVYQQWTWKEIQPYWSKKSNV